MVKTLLLMTDGVYKKVKKNSPIDENRCFIIAEIGVNHNGELSIAKQLIYEAKKAGADAVKFQTFKANLLSSPLTPKVKYQLNNSKKEETHYEMLKNLELSYEDHFILKSYCDELGIEFMSTPYDVESAIFLNEEIDVSVFKTASADIVDIPLHNYIASTDKKSIVSVGMANLGEIETIYNIYKSFARNNLIFLHCVSNYPCSNKSLNLKVIKTLQQTFQVPVGYSDHSLGNIASIISIAYGSKVIEKHLTIDKELPGPDHFASSNPTEFTELVAAIKTAEEMLGSSVKECQNEEIEMAKVSRKSLHLKRDIKEGEILSKEDLCLMRPGTGLGYSQIVNLIGKKALANLKKGLQINFSDLG